MRISPLAVLVLAACGNTEYQPPVFNAYDPTIQCQAGFVGWDFSTGGAFGQDITSAKISNELQIVEATFGASCGLTDGNWTDVFAATCNGNLSCSRKVLETGDVNPKTGCAKSFTVKYRCGDEPAVYQTDLPAATSTDATTVSLACNDKMTIKRVSYGANCKASLANNFTTPIADACNGLRRCKLPKVSGGYFSGDLAPNCNKKTEVVFLCGDDPTENTTTWNDTDIGDFTCPPRQTVLGTNDSIRILSATYGTNCGGATNNIKSWVEGPCAGRAACLTTLAPVGFDPCPNVRKDLAVQYTCGNEGITYTKKVLQQSQAQFTLYCGDIIHIAEASYGKNCNAANANNLRPSIAGSCEGKRFCGPGAPNNLIPDPAVGCVKTANLRWSCGDEPAIFSKDFAETDLIQLECQVARQTPGPASGIRIEKATFGQNCDAGISNNAYTQATQQCFGKPLCSFAASAAGVPDPAYGCQKALSVDYTCGEDVEVRNATVPANQEGTAAQLLCGPAIHVTSATWGLNVNASFAGNATDDVRQTCEGHLSRCTYVVKDLVDPSYGQQKDFTIKYTCGPDPKVYSASLAKPADNLPLTFECPTPTTPYVDKACVPERCYDNQRRDQRLQCVNDNSLPNLGVITASAFTATGANGYVLRALAENQAYNLALRIQRADRSVVAVNYSADAGTVVPVSPAAIWVSDQFTHIPGTPYALGLETVPAYRCLIGTTSIKAINATQYAADINNAVISPSCFGSRISSWRDAARRVRWTEADFRRSYTMDETKHEVRVSFDPEGRAIAWRYNGGAGDQHLVPNPIGMFYDPTRLWADFYSYYSQTELKTTHPSVGGFGSMGYTFFTNHTLEVLAQEATLRDTMVTIPLFDPGETSIDLDFVWSMQNDSPGKNPFSPTGTPVSSAVQTLAQRHFGATVEFALDSAYQSRASGSQWVNAVDTQIVNRSTTQPDTQLSGGLATGKSEHIRVSFTNTLRDRLWKPWNGAIGSSSNYGWNGTTGHEADMTLLRVRVCLNADGFSAPPYSANQYPSGVTVQRGGEYWDLAPTRQCAVSPQVLIVKRDRLLHSSPVTKNQDSSETGNSNDQGDSNASTKNDNGSETGCGTDAGSTTCGSTDKSTLVSGGQGGRSLMDNQTFTQGGNDTAGNGSVTVGARTELLGFNVINSDADNTPSAKPLNLGWQSFDSIAPKPNWGNIYKRLKQAYSGTSAASPFKPEIGEWSKRPKYPGIGIGFAYTYLWSIGPVPVMLEFKFGIHAGLGGPASFTMRRLPSSSSDPVDYPCISNTSAKCLILSSEQQQQEIARTNCRVRGGRLVELDSQAAVTAAQTRAASANEEFWVGGQLAYGFADSRCALPGADLNLCANASNTFFEWTDSQTPFASMNGRSSQLVMTGIDAGSWGGVQGDLTGLTTAVPSPAQVAFRASNRRLTTYAQSTAKKLRYLCEYDPAPAAYGYTYTLTAGLDMGVGFGFSVCVPSSELGVCLVAAIDLMQMSIDYNHAVTKWTLLDSPNGRRIGTRTNTNNNAYWETRFLTGEISAELHTFFINLKWTIVRFNGIQTLIGNGTDLRVKLYEANFPSRSNQ